MRVAAESSLDPADYEFRHQVRVRFAETDAMGIVHHSRYLPMMEEARVAYLRHIDHPYSSIRESGIEMAVLEVFLQYRVPLKFDEIVDVHVSLTKVDRATFQMGYLLSVAGQVRATAVTVHGAIFPDGRATRLPAWFRELKNDHVPRHFTIGSDELSVDVAPDNGGRVAQITANGIPLLVGPGEGPDSGSAMAWGSYPMVPWAGRVRRGRFVFGDVEHHLPPNLGGHAIHGVGYDAPWSVTHHDALRVDMELTMPSDSRWPFGGTAHQTISVDGATLRMELSATAGTHPMPVSLGWHPWFRKPDQLGFEPTAMYRRDDDYITVDELVEVPPSPWDDCFVNTNPVRLTVGGIELRLTSNCTDWVVYDMPAHATCVEPQTGPPDAFTIRPHRLAPGETLSAWYEITLGS